MSMTTPVRVARLDSVLEGRRDQIGFRLGVGLCLIVFYNQLIGLTPSLVWCGLYAALQLIELRLFERGVRLERLRTRTGYNFALGLLAANTLVFGSLSILWTLKTGSWGVANGAFLIAGAMLNTVLTTQQSEAAFRASALPLAFYCAVLPFAAYAIGSKADLSLDLAIGGGMLCATALKLWNGAHRSQIAEQAARADAERRRAEAESAVAAKSAFVAMVSHELRTPISAILAGAAELDRQSDGAARSHARLISDAGSMMRTLLNDLLDLAKLDAGRMAVEALSFDFRALIADQLRFWRAEARKRGVALRLTGAASAPRWVRGDPTRLRQVLNNLLSNALKFTEHGSVTCAISVSPLEDGRLSLKIEVSDTGCGMTAEQIDQLFIPFHQADSSIARTHGGTGLGLVISRQLARMMDGDLTVSSLPGHGSSFIVTLVVAAAAPPGPVQLQATDAPAGTGKPITVLVVDDHEINRRAMSLMLEPLSAEVTLAASGGEALSLLAARAFDVVLMDVHMPDMSGPEAVMRLRLAAGPNRQVPVIAVTGATEESDIQACLAAGMTDWVAKPIDAGQLYDALARQLESAGTDAAAA